MFLNLRYLSFNLFTLIIVPSAGASFVKVIVVFFSLVLNAQDSLLSQNDKLSKREKWKILRLKTERDVDKGEISRGDADKKYSRFRSHLLGKKAERKDPVLENHFKKFGEKYVKAFYAIPAPTKKTYFSCVPVAQE